jgi:phage gp45-like
MTPDVQRFVREEIKRQLNVILSGQSDGTADVETESIASMFPGSPTIADRPVMHPYGFASRASRGTIQVVGKQGADPSNRLVLGHRDSQRPTDLDEGEAVLYSSAQWAVYARADGVQITDALGQYTVDVTSDGVLISAGTPAVTALVDAAGVHVDLGAAGKFSFANVQGEFLASLIQILTTATAGGFPLVVDPASLLILQSMQE